MIFHSDSFIIIKLFEKNQQNNRVRETIRSKWTDTLSNV